MARTLVGQLILRLRAEGLGEANKVQQALANVDRAVKRMGTVGSWGVGFQKQLAALKLAPADLRQVEQSWVRLHDSIKQNNLDKSLRGNAISQWKTNTLAELAQARGDWDRHYAAIERNTKAHAARMQGLMKPLMVSMGFYTAAYGGGLMLREGIGASSERRREYFRQQMAGIPEADQQKIFDQAQGLSQKYPSADITAIMEAARNAYTYMGNMEESAQILEAMVQGFVVMQSARGPEAAWSNLNKMIRGFDILGVNEVGKLGIDQTTKLIEAIVRAAQVDPEFDPEGYLSFSRRAKTAGPALSQDFLARAPVYMQDLGSDVTGNALAMAFKAFALEAVGSAGGKKYLAERERIGVRSGDGLVDNSLFGSDPDLWVQKHLVPALQKDGVNLDDATAVATAVGKLTGNSNASALLTRMITQRAQTERWLRLMDQTMGLGAAGEVRDNDPFVAFEALKASLENLSAALVPIDTITSGLNSLADGINKLAKYGEENPAAAAAMLGAGVGGTVLGTKKAFDLFSSGFGLTKSAAALDGSAAALTRAAYALGAGGVGDMSTGGNGRGRPRRIPGGRGIAGTVGLTAAVSTGVAVLAGPERAAELQAEADQRAFKFQQTWNRLLESLIEQLPEPSAPPPPNPDGSFAGTGQPVVGLGAPVAGYSAEQIEEAKRKAAEAGRDIQTSMSPTAKPVIDLSMLDVAIAKATHFIALLRQASAEISTSNSTIGTELRRNMSD